MLGSNLLVAINSLSLVSLFLVAGAYMLSVKALYRRIIVGKSAIRGWIKVINIKLYFLVVLYSPENRFDLYQTLLSAHKYR
jgi:hypothetical protein